MKTTVTCLAAGLTLALGVAACGSDDNGGGTGAGTTPAVSSTGGSAAASGLADVKARVAEDEAGTATFPAPKDAFDPGSHKATIIACGFQAPVCASAAKEADKAVKAMGWTSSGALDGKLSPQTQAGLVTKAVQQGDDAIVIYGIDVNSIKAPIQQALAKKIAISCIQCNSGALRGQVMDSTPDFTAEGEQIGRYIVARNNGKADLTVFEDNAFPQTVLRTEGVTAAVKAACPGCKLETKQESVAETAQPGPPAFTALLSANPAGSGLTDVVALYDGIGLPMATTLKSNGRKDMQVAGYDADKPVVQAIANGSLAYSATIAPPVSYATWAAVDLVGRKVAGKPTWDATKLPTVLVTKNNAAKYIGAEFQPEGDWRATFKSLWGTA